MQAPVFVETPAVEPEDDLADLLVELGERAPRFAVVDEGSAAWVVDKLISADEKAARLKAQYEEMLAAIKKDKARLERRFLPELEAWFRTQDKKGKKSIRLLTGTLATRTVPGKPEALGVVDPAAALDWAQTNLPGAVKAVPTLDTAAIVAWVGETGEMVPGVELLPGRPDYESFSIKGVK